MLNYISKMAANIVVKPNAKHTATVIFLHGLGDQGNGWAAGFEDIQEGHIKYIFPNAPVMPVTLNGGYMMPSWFDLFGLTPGGKEDEVGIMKASDNLKNLIAEEEKLVSSNRIVIGGFSQGGALALYTAVTLGKPVGGVLGLSTWLPLHKRFPQAAKNWNSGTNVLQCHGDVDPVVPFQFGKMTSDLLKSFTSPNYEFKTYTGLAHSSSAEEMSDVKQWLQKVLPSKN